MFSSNELSGNGGNNMKQNFMIYTFPLMLFRWLLLYQGCCIDLDM